MCLTSPVLQAAFGEKTYKHKAASTDPWPGVCLLIRATRGTPTRCLDGRLSSLVLRAVVEAAERLRSDGQDGHVQRPKPHRSHW